MRRVVALCLCGALTACGFSHVNRDRASRPERTTGTAARVVMPGEAVPMDPPRPEQTVMIGGTSAETDASQKVRDVPLGPLAVLFGYPFWIVRFR
jgi:hypothetical protein